MIRKEKIKYFHHHVQERILIKIFLQVILFCSFILLVSCFSPIDRNTNSTLDLNQDYFVIINSLSNNFSVYSVSDNLMTKDFKNILEDSGSNAAPNEILSADNRLFVINSLDNSLSVFDFQLGFREKISLGSGKNPYSLAYDSVNKRILITDFTAQSFDVIDISDTDHIMLDRTIAVTGSVTPQGVSVTQDYVLISDINLIGSTTYGDADLYVYDRNTLSFLYKKTLSGVINVQKIRTKETDNQVDVIATGDYEHTYGSVFRYNIAAGDMTEIAELDLDSTNDFYLDYYYDSLNDLVYITGVNTLYSYKQSGFDQWEKIKTLQDATYLTGVLITNQYALILAGTENKFYMVDLNTKEVILETETGFWPCDLVFLSL